MENENKITELEQVEEKGEVVSEEAVAEVPIQEAEPISYSSSYLEKIEEERKAFLKIYKFQNTLKWIVSAVCIVAVVFACIFIPNLIGGTTGTVVMVSILVAALAGTILYSVFSRQYIRKKMHSYFDSYYENINHYVFDSKEITNLKAQFPGRIEPVAFTDNNLYKDVIDVGSRGLTEFEFNSIPVAIVDCAASVRKEKRVVPVYVGKYLFAASNYQYDEPLYIYFKGDKRALPPTNLADVKTVLDDKKMYIATANKDWKKVINADVKKILQNIEMNKELVDLSISLQKGRIFVCMGYDDPLMVLPLQQQFDPKPTEIFKKDVVHALHLIEEFNK